jgi:hypothetical protein
MRAAVSDVNAYFQLANLYYGLTTAFGDYGVAKQINTGKTGDLEGARRCGRLGLGSARVSHVVRCVSRRRTFLFDLSFRL